MFRRLKQTLDNKRKILESFLDALVIKFFLKEGVKDVLIIFVVSRNIEH